MTTSSSAAGPDAGARDTAVEDAAVEGAGVPDTAVEDAGTRDAEREPQVGLMMGSDSDWRVLGAAAEILDDFDVPYEVGVYSAHRTPERMLDYASLAAARGLRVIIAGAGGAAHLPGMVASATVLPVIGVPVKLKSLDGLDSLLSIVQMPQGVPVATVSIDGAANAALLAVRMLAAMPDAAGRDLAAELAAYHDDLRASVLAKHQALQTSLFTERQAGRDRS